MLKEDQNEPRTIILEMVSGGATKTAIAKALGVTDMTILSVSQGKTKTFSKLKKLQSVYSRWKAGKLDLSGKRGKKRIEAPATVEALAGKKVSTGKKAQKKNLKSVKKTKVTKEPVVAVKSKRSGRPLKNEIVAVPFGFQLPTVTEAMVAGVEEQIKRLQAEAQFMRKLIAIRKKYGQ